MVQSFWATPQHKDQLGADSTKTTFQVTGNEAATTLFLTVVLALFNTRPKCIEFYFFWAFYWYLCTKEDSTLLK